MNKIACFFLLALSGSVLLAPPAFAGKVKAQKGTEADFARYKTYNWFPPRVLTKVGIVEDHPANPVLQAIVDQELSKKGLSKTDRDPDLMIQAYVLGESVPQLEAVLITLGVGNFYGETVVVTSRYNRQGTMVLNLIDTRTKKSAWSAYVTESLPEKKLSDDKLKSKLAGAAAKMFAKYPAMK